VLGVTPDAPPATVRRLQDLGFTVGTTVEVVRRAPLRDPVIYRVRDYDVCLRRAQAAYLLTGEISG
jgi:ferrous iron transport protein A